MPELNTDVSLPNEYESMLEDYTGLKIEDIVVLWKRVGSPAIPVGPGNTIIDLARYLERGIVNLEQLSILGEWVKMFQGEGYGKGNNDKAG